MIAAESIGARDALKTSLALLGAAFNRSVDKTIATAYWIALRDLTPGEISAATERALERCKFFPAPAELRALAGRPTGEASAAEAWEAVRGAIDQHDYTTSVDFGPLVNAIVRNLGGWQRLCGLDIEDLNVWARKEFERVYALFAPKDPTVLNGAPHRGALGGMPVRIAIGGRIPPAALPAKSFPRGAEAMRLVHELAEAKS